MIAYQRVHEGHTPLLVSLATDEPNPILPTTGNLLLWEQSLCHALPASATHNGVSLQDPASDM